MVHDAECSQGKTLWCHQGHARVKPDMRVFGHQRVGYEPFVGRCVSNDKQVRLQDSMGAKRNVPGRFLDRQTDLRLEPLPLPVDEADQRDRGAANVSGQTRQIVKLFFGSGVKNLVLMKDMKPSFFMVASNYVGLKAPPLCVSLYRASIVSFIFLDSGKAPAVSR